MEIKQLERFLAVVKHGSLSAAAKNLNLTQQALSSSISKLEKDIDLKLFERAPGGAAKLTSYGRALVRHARAQIAGLRRAEQELHAIRDATRGTITLGIGEAFSGEIIASAVAALHDMRPEIRVNLVEGYSELLLERLREGEFDFLAASTGGLHMVDGLSYELMYTSDDVIAVRPQHPLSGKKNLDLKELQNFTWLVPYSRSSDYSVIVDSFVSQRLDPPKRIIGTDAYRIGMHLMLNNDYLFMSPLGLIGEITGNHGGILEVLDINNPTVKRHAHLIYPAQRPMSPVAQMLLQEIREMCEELSL
jgi:molybdate transport repressor ModE-like protein